jgi:hypothetical protein
MSIGLGNSSNIQMPGVVFTDSGSSDPNFGAGDASLKKWMVKDSLDVPSATSYVAMKKTITDNHITIQPSPCPDVNNCALPTTSSTPGGVVYTIGQASDTVKITSGTTFAHDNSANDKFTFLIPGNLDIGANISALPGSVVTFIVGGDITVEPTVGTGKGNYTVSTSNIDGYYAAGGSFTVKGNSDCVSANPDQRLNISGAIVTNTNRAGGNFVVQRDMCGGDVCPTFSIQARPDFVLNTPSYLLSPNINWDEVAP